MISWNTSETDYTQQCGVHVSEQTYVSGQDKPNDRPEYQNQNFINSFWIHPDLSEFGGGAWPLLDFSYLGL